jgi:hypothetical protein
MKYKMLALIVALTVVSWAQTETQTAAPAAPQTTAPADKAKCACCDKMAAGEMKEMKSCCAHHDMQGKDMQGKDVQAKDGKEMASCCAGKEGMSGKDAKACMRKGKDKTASCCKGDGKNSCCKDKIASACCGDKCEKDGKGCCGGKDKTAKSCCQKEVRS